MDPEFWRARWREGRIGFHRAEVHPDLLRHGELLTDGAGVLVPLCGKSVDLPWLAARVPVVGVELAEEAVAQLHEEHGLAPEVERVGPFTAWRTPNLVVLQGDLFDLRPEHLPHPVDRAWDRAALIALDQDRRRRYAAQLRDLLAPAGRILLEALTYDPHVMEGPPHSVPDSEVVELYAGASIEQLDVRDALDDRWRAAGHSWWRTTVWRIDFRC